MKKNSIFAFCLIFFIACGGGGGDSKPPKDDKNTEQPIIDEIISDKYFYQQWYLDKNDDFYKLYSIDSKASINSGDYFRQYTGRGIKIAVIDNALDLNHKDLESAVVASYDLTTKSENVLPSLIEDDEHGTTVTGLLAARTNSIGIRGIAPRSEIIFLKHKDEASLEEVVSLFNKANELGADIINCSWGTYDVSDVVKDTIINLSKNGRSGKGIPIVFAAGNDNVNIFDENHNDESNIPEVISVSSTEKNNLRANYSNYGKNLDILAPGGDFELGISTLSLNNTYRLVDDYLELPSGTSYAAPIVSGVIAMMLEANPALKASEIQEILKKTADKIGDVYYDKKGHNQYYGHGKINAKKAIDLAIKLKN